MDHKAISEIIEAVKASGSIAITTHTNPDADAYGSACGLAWGLRALGKEVAVYNDHGFVPRYKAIPGAENVQKGSWGELSSEQILFVVDCGAADRVGDLLVADLRKAPKVINIDHHASNSMFGHLNLVAEGASSTSELIFTLLKSCEKSFGRDDLISTNAAACLLAGIIGDTGSFRYPSTTAATFKVAAELVERGAKPDILTQELFATQSLVALRLQSEALCNVVVHPNGFAEVTVTQEMIARNNADILDADSLAERARDVEGVKVSALYKQDVDLWRVSLRSRRGVVDVSAIAQSFGGGGHKAAAAFRWRQDLPTLQHNLRDAITKALA
jgi:phosphoesterase RecJ-like protein